MKVRIATAFLFATLALGGCGKGSETTNTTETTTATTAAGSDNVAADGAAAPDNAADLGGNALEASGGNASNGF